VSIQADSEHVAPSQAAGVFDLSTLRQVFSTGRTRDLNWRLAQLEGIERLCDETSRAIKIMRKLF
jgi:hypothetical protein